MIVVSDTSAITNLFQINKLELLKSLYQKINIPPAVFEELSQIPVQRNYILSSDWIKIIRPSNQNLIDTLLVDLDLGESEAIALALEISADYIIIDERKGRNIANQYDLQVVGIIGLFIQCKQENIIPNVKDLLDELIDQTSFYINPNFYHTILSELGEI